MRRSTSRPLKLGKRCLDQSVWLAANSGWLGRGVHRVSLSWQPKYRTDVHMNVSRISAIVGPFGRYPSSDYRLGDNGSRLRRTDRWQSGSFFGELTTVSRASEGTTKSATLVEVCDEGSVQGNSGRVELASAEPSPEAMFSGHRPWIRRVSQYPGASKGSPSSTPFLDTPLRRAWLSAASWQADLDGKRSRPSRCPGPRLSLERRSPG